MTKQTALICPQCYNVERVKKFELQQCPKCGAEMKADVLAIIENFLSKENTEWLDHPQTFLETQVANSTFGLQIKRKSAEKKFLEKIKMLNPGKEWIMNMEIGDLMALQYPGLGFSERMRLTKGLDLGKYELDED